MIVRLRETGGEVALVFRLDLDPQRRKRAHHPAVEAEHHDEVDACGNRHPRFEDRPGGVVDLPARVHRARRAQHRPVELGQAGALAARLIGHRVEIGIGHPGLIADLEMMAVLVGASRQPADLEEPELAKASVEWAVVAEVHGERTESACHIRTMRKRLRQVDWAGEHVAIACGEVAGLEIANTGHQVFTGPCSDVHCSRCNRRSASRVHGPARRGSSMRLRR